MTGAVLVCLLAYWSQSLLTGAEYFFISLPQYPSLLRFLGSHDHDQLVLPSVPFTHINERGSNGPVRWMSPDGVGRPSLRQSLWWGREGSRQWASLPMSRGRTVIRIPGKKGKKNTLTGELSLSLKEDILSLIHNEYDKLGLQISKPSI